MDWTEFLRRVRRCFESSPLSARRLYAFCIVVFVIVYVWPTVLQFFTSRKSRITNPNGRCLSDRLSRFHEDMGRFDAVVKHVPLWDTEQPFFSFVGNGKIGVHVAPEGPLYLKYGRVLSLLVPFHPVITVTLDGASHEVAEVIQLSTGLIHRYQCISRPTGAIDVQYVGFVHRMMPSIFVQEIKISNPTDEDVFFDMDAEGIMSWEGVAKSTMSIDVHGETQTFVLVTGQVPIPDDSSQFFAVAILSAESRKNYRVRARSVASMVPLTSVHYTGPIVAADFADAIEETVKQAKADLLKAALFNGNKFKEDHKRVWQSLWRSGFGISYSRAYGALNGDTINATIYYVLSHTRTPLHELGVGKERQKDLEARLAQPDRCYDGHHTLQAPTLWSHLTTAADVGNMVSLWKLTLEKQGCHSMLLAGADGVLQAMILSFGGLKFANHHLEFFTHPKDLHRDYHFRRISYGNATHVNISVVLGDDNKAALYVALDRSDKTYYACDGGCLDPPVQLSQEYQQFPVKLTEPPTAILYITANKQHMEDLKHTIHVKEVGEAPAHEHHIIALHRHGHHLGGLPTLFWVSIAFLVLVFHLFLFKLIYNEYCTNHDKFRARYAL